MTKALNAQKILREINKEPQHHYEVKFIPGGHYTTVRILHISNGDCKVMKVSIRPEEAGLIQRRIMRYHELMKQSGISVPESIDICLSKDYMIELAPFCGTCLEDEFLTVDAEICSRFLKSTFDFIIRPLFKTTDQSMLSIGIDPIPRNITKNGKKLYFIDFHPPKYNGMLEVPEPTNPIIQKMGLWRHYNKTGIIFILLMQLSKLRPDLRAIFQKIIFEELIDMKEVKVFHDLRQMPSVNLGLKDKEAIAERITTLNAQSLDYFELRDWACRIAFEGNLPYEFLREIFSLTHFSSEPPGETQIITVKREIINALAKI